MSPTRGKPSRRATTTDLSSPRCWQRWSRRATWSPPSPAALNTAATCVGAAAVQASEVARRFLAHFLTRRSLVFMMRAARQAGMAASFRAALATRGGASGPRVSESRDSKAAAACCDCRSAFCCDEGADGMVRPVMKSTLGGLGGGGGSHCALREAGAPAASGGVSAVLGTPSPRAAGDGADPPAGAVRRGRRQATARPPPSEVGVARARAAGGSQVPRWRSVPGPRRPCT